MRKSDRYLKKMIKKLGLEDNVNLHGQVDEKDKERLFNQCDYFIYLSRFDGPPRPIREAISFGIPPIVSHQTSMSHLIEMFNAGIAVELNPVKIGNMLSKLCINNGTRLSFEPGLKELKEKLNWDEVALDYKKEYMSLIEKFKLFS
jgi:glycosyltransferase involved in cell wall biosynthesis